MVVQSHHATVNAGGLFETCSHDDGSVTQLSEAKIRWLKNTGEYIASLDAINNLRFKYRLFWSLPLCSSNRVCCCKIHYVSFPSEMFVPKFIFLAVSPK